MRFLDEKDIKLVRSTGWEIKYPSRIGFKFNLFKSLEVELPSKVRSGVYEIGSIGAYSYLGDGEYHSVASIGRFCSVAGGQKWGLYEHYLQGLTTSPLHQNKFWEGTEYQEFFDRNSLELQTVSRKEKELNDKLITIGNDVWIGDGVFIKKGVSVGDGAVIAARSVVVKDVEPYSIVGGVPASLISKRASEATISKLLQFKWWEYDLKILDGLDFSDLEAAALILEKRVNSDFLRVKYPTIRINSDFEIESDNK